MSLCLFQGQRRSTKTMAGQAEDLLPALGGWFEALAMSVHGLSGIAVTLGGNRFSLQRQAVVVANALGYALSIPVATMTRRFDEPAVQLDDIQRLFRDDQPYAPVRAGYSQPPSISKPKGKKLS